jgi:expansin
MSNHAFGLGTLASVLAALGLSLSACDSTEGTGCATNAECLSGESCVAGTCRPGAGPGVAGNASGGKAGATGTGGAGGGTSAGSTSGGAAVAGGSSGGMAGGSSTGGVSSGGNNNNGGQSGSDSTSGSGGSGGLVDPGPTIGKCDNDFWPAASNGSLTRYDFKQGTSLPACAYVITHTGNGSDGDWDTVEGISTGDGGYFGAMNTEDYNKGAACGACVEVTYNQRTIVLTIVDECPLTGPVSNPKCVKGHIDLSRKAIRQLEPNSNLEDLHNASWKYVKCPASGSIKARLHPNQNADWQPVVIENGLFPIKSVTLNGVEAKRVGNDEGGNAWEAPGQKAPYVARVTDVNGNAITINVAGGNELQDTGKQFMCQ